MSPSLAARLTVVALSCLCAPATASAQRPNVVLILADDLGWGELGVYGQERILTPNLDALAARGRYFRQAYAAAPVCAPSRCAILTGLTVAHCRVPENARPNTPLSLDDLNLGLVLSGAGYRTDYIGKWGLGGELDDGSPFATFSRPDRVGFDGFVGFLDQELATDAFPAALHFGEERRVFPENAGDLEGRWSATVLVEAALDVIAHADGHQPFFLLFAPTLPHREYRVPSSAMRYADRGWPEVEASYASMITELDDEVGRILRALSEHGLTESTVVVFTSDNGPNEIDGHVASFFASTGGLRGRKRDLYEGGLRVPLIVAGPSIAASATPFDTPVALYDLLPTFAELAEAPELAGLDGRSLVPLLHGGPAPEREALFFASEESRAAEAPKAQYRVRAGDLALVELLSGGFELYDLGADPNETRDLAAERPADVARLRAIREGLTAARAAIPPPRLSIEGIDVIDPEPPASETAVALAFDFEPDGDPLASRIPLPSRRLLPMGGAAVADGALALMRSATGERTAHAVLAPHPSFGVGGGSMSFRARLRLPHARREPLPRTGPLDREVIACARPAGRPERFTDWAVLARVGGEDDGAGHLGVLFGDPTLGEGRNARDAAAETPIPIASALAILDGDWHTLEVRFDAARAQLTLILDGVEDHIAIPDRADYPSDGPLLLGACLDEAGRAEHGMVGDVDDVVLARGAGEIHLPTPRLGSIALAAGEAGPRTVRFTLVNPAVADTAGRALAIAIELGDATPVRARLDGPSERLLLPGARSEVTLTLDGPPGAFETEVRIVATDALLGTLALGTPTIVTIRGTVAQRPSSIGAVEGGLFFLVFLGAAALAWRRLRPPTAAR